MSIATEISRLQTAKADLKTSIEAKGVTVPSEALIDTYDTYVNAIETPEWKDPDWVDINELYEADTSSGYTYKTYALIGASDNETILPAGFAYKTSDGAFYNDLVGHTHTWNKSLDLYDSRGIPYRWIAYYKDTAISDSAGSTPNFNRSIIWVIDGFPRASNNRIYGSFSVSNTYNYSHCKLLLWVDFKNNSWFGDSCFRSTINLIGFSTYGNNYQLNRIDNVAVGGINNLKYIETFQLSERAVGSTLGLKYLKFTSHTSVQTGTFNDLPALEFLDVPADWNSDAQSIVNSIHMSAEALNYIIGRLKDRSLETAYTFIMGATNLAKLTPAEIAVATAKNWTLA